MFSKAEKQRNKKTGLKQRSTQQAIRHFGLSAHQTHPATIIQRTQKAPRSLTSQDMLHLQRTIGNQAVDQLPTKATENSNSAVSRVEALMQRVQTPAALRAALAADPSLGAAIQAYFAMGNEDAQLNSLLSQAYPKGGRSATANETADNTEPTITEKAGTGAGAMLPPARTGNKKLTKGNYKWSLTPISTTSPEFKADFKPDHTKVEAKAVSFGQTVLNQVGAMRIYAGGTRADPAKKKATYEPFEESTKHTRIDFHPGTENDPYYGAQWDQTNKKWVREATAGSAVGSSEKGVSSTSATMSDPPELGPVAREGKGTAAIEFETVAVVLETREPLGALKWGFQIKDKADAPLELTGAKDADCVDAPSDEWGKAMDKFYEARFDTILDNFDIAKYDLKPDHKTKLDGIVTRMKAKPALKAQLGGAADLTGSAKFNKKLALQRANAAKAYLVKKGIPAGRIEVQSYSFDWARVRAEKGKSEGKNRRVQVWLR
jgi:outer membrane protein OmpA-like peptidoglycan-associated protein